LELPKASPATPFKCRIRQMNGKTGSDTPGNLKSQLSGKVTRHAKQVLGAIWTVMPSLFKFRSSLFLPNEELTSDIRMLALGVAAPEQAGPPPIILSERHVEPHNTRLLSFTFSAFQIHNCSPFPWNLAQMSAKFKEMGEQCVSGCGEGEGE